MLLCWYRLHRLLLTTFSKLQGCIYFVVWSHEEEIHMGVLGGLLTHVRIAERRLKSCEATEYEQQS